MESLLPENWRPPPGFLATKVLDTDLKLWEPRQFIASVEWLEKNIRIPERTSDFAGFYSSDNFPYQAGPLEAFDDIEVKEISLEWATQTGKSLLIQSLIAKIADTDPSPMMFVCPDSTTAKEVSSERIMPTAESVPRIRVRLLPEGRRNDLKPDFGDCVVYMAWSGSPTSLGQKAVRYVFGTELDKWSRNKSFEADAADLVRERVKAFWNHKIIFEGTPTIEGASRIDQLGKDANQRFKYHIPCPYCGKHQVLDFKRVKFKKGKDGKLDRDLAETTAYYQCGYCKKKINDYHKMAMLRAGVWAEVGSRIRKNFKGRIFWTPGKNKTRVHFDLSSLYSPILEFGDVAGEFVRCQQGDGKRTLQNFINSWLAQTWNINIREYKWKEVQKTLQADEPRGTIPEWVYFLTAGIDVQKGWAVYNIRGWGFAGRSRLIEWGQVVTYRELEDKILKRNFYQKATGDSLQVILAGIDSGYQPAEVYEWTNQMNFIYGERVRAIKGVSKGAPYWMSQIDRSGADGKVIEGGIQLWNIWDHHWKSYVTGKYETPAGRAGAWEIPNDVDEVYMRSITSEVLQKKVSKTGHIKFEWILADTTIGNHFLDTEKIAATMADMVDWRDLPENRPEREKKIATQAPAQGSELLIGSEDFLDD